MKLGKLLAAGKSFFGGRGGVAYRENKHVYLPKFNAQTNLFSATPASPAAVPVHAPAAAPTAPAPAAAPKRIFQTAPARPMPSKASGLAAWTGKLNPFRPAPVVEAPARKAVQTEMSLNAVKVIHNDLADADIEVVPARSCTVDSSTMPVLSPTRSNGMEFLSGRSGAMKTA